MIKQFIAYDFDQCIDLNGRLYLYIINFKKNIGSTNIQGSG